MEPALFWPQFLFCFALLFYQFQTKQHNGLRYMLLLMMMVEGKTKKFLIRDIAAVTVIFEFTIIISLVTLWFVIGRFGLVDH